LHPRPGLERVNALLEVDHESARFVARLQLPPRNLQCQPCLDLAVEDGFRVTVVGSGWKLHHLCHGRFVCSKCCTKPITMGGHHSWCQSTGFRVTLSCPL